MSNYIFVVDDDISVRNGISRLLRAAGHNVRVFANIVNFAYINNLESSVFPDGVRDLIGKNICCRILKNKWDILVKQINNE